MSNSGYPVGQANAAYAPVTDEKRPPLTTATAAASEIAAVTGSTVAAFESAAAQAAPNVFAQGAPQGGQYPNEAPPSYSQPGYQQYPPPQGYPQGAYPQQAAYPPQAPYPQAGGPQPGYAPGGYNSYPAPKPQPTHTTSVVVVGSGSAPVPNPPKENDWDKGLCGCFSNCGLCLLSWLCPCYVVGKYAEALGHNCLLWGVGSIIPIVRCVAHVLLRIELRDRRGIKGSEFDDFLFVCCCSCCALIQEAHEVRLMENQEISRE